MTDKKPCCPAGAAREIRLVVVDEKRVGLDHLDKVISEVRALGIEDPGLVDEELLRRVKVYNYVPRGLEESYLAAVRKEYESATKEARLSSKVD